MAVMFLDYVWATFVLLGIEKLRIVPGFTAGSPLDAYYMPYSHSLIAALICSGVAASIYRVAWRVRASKAAALLVGLAVLSHWLLDFVAHPRDLAIYDNRWKLGLGFWNYRGPEFALEIGLLAAGIWLYLRRNAVSAAHTWGIIILGIGLVVVQIGDTFVPRSPLTPHATASGVLIFYTLFGGVVFALGRIRLRDAKPLA